MLLPNKIVQIITPKNNLVSDPDWGISELGFDSRKLTFPAQTLFFAIKTAKNDGHLYIPELIKQKVKNFIVSENLDHYKDFNANFYQVDDPVWAMQQIAAEHRKNFNYPVVGITGSNGKTIVKEWLSTILSKDFSVIKNPNSYNSQIGVPLSVWQMNANYNFGIFEAGISQKNEMEKLEAIIKPNIGILTNIGNAHSGFFESDKEKLLEKLRLFKTASTIIYNNDAPLIRKTFENDQFAHLQKISWGKHQNSHYKIVSQKQLQNTTIVEFSHTPEWLEIPFVDAASVENVLHISALLMFMGYSLSDISKRLCFLSPLSMRMEVKEAQNQSIIINDTYSLDVNSLRIALDFLSTQTQYAKKTLIISDFEQVNWGEKEYIELSKIFDNHNITKMIVVGNEMRKWHGYFPVVEKYFYATTNELLTHLDDINIRDEAVLIKGARSFKFERVVQALQLKTHQTILQVDLSAIIHNLHFFKKILHPETKIMAMVKAMSYGLGDAELINELCYHKVDYLAVAYADEGITLRKRNITRPIVVLGAEANGFDLMIRYHLEPEIFNLFYLKELIATLQNYSEIENFPIHIKVDTGMHRLGFDEDEIAEMLQLVNASPQLKIASVFTHLAASEDAKEDVFTQGQINKFKEVCQKIDMQISYPYLKHILNSAGVMRFPEAQFDMVRLGLGLYGFCPLPEVQQQLQSVITLNSVITQLKKVKKGGTVGYNRTFIAPKDMQIAIVPVGYADGFPREFSNGVGAMLVRNKKCPIVGKVSMDMTMIDVTGLDIAINDEVIIYDAENSLEKMGAKIGKIPYELLTAISKRVPRIYVRE
ncbi:MAG: bifunctional UDP-N-acetylmuramoyl-tripeptide:D-alanyl-D-alanine ligase/alanine racemase [Bacteroidetes bacterium]|nr:bifunctional UDP-N-acetylmuramoyl-tripeptide:D-alanyl-D-alanine ligase/alanine racemase [Bacteroidota bacterium]MCL2302047.1 bifunctional UDP-N-acetylmuramoyl-tripeptide:D-alanyl-D-alanine ligase/alanine racemase [Lentimicrobiaceae bacterium]